ncbi:hypothetical protein [Nonomuraea sp. NPDC049784]|uniref:hypothetical protein n=1 Tax=Nonomuraea sp. NPDC049784 TaxID=3154361 RepID=UPI0033FDC65B
MRTLENALGDLHPPTCLQRGAQLVGWQRRGGGLKDALDRHVGIGEVDLGVGAGLGLKTPAVGQRSGIDGVEPEPADQLRCPNLRVDVIAGDGQGAAVRGSGGPGEQGDVMGQDVVEGLDQQDAGQQLLGQTPKPLRRSTPTNALFTKPQSKRRVTSSRNTPSD